MIVYFFLIALLNIGIGYALALYLARSRAPQVVEEAFDSTPESDSVGYSTDAEETAPVETDLENGAEKTVAEETMVSEAEAAETESVETEVTETEIAETEPEPSDERTETPVEV